jgi:uncharacterized protein (DUF433 family)
MDLTKWIADDPETLGGRVVFVGTRIPVDTLPSLEEVRQAGRRVWPDSPDWRRENLWRL